MNSLRQGFLMEHKIVCFFRRIDLKKLAWCKYPKWLLVNQCCYCVPVRKGVIIFGYVNLILSLLSLPFVIFVLGSYLTNEQIYDDEEQFTYTEPARLYITIVFVLIDIGMTVVLLVGAIRKQNNLLKIYFYFGLLFQIVTLAVDLRYFNYLEYLENSIYMLFFGLNIYLLILVYSTIRITEEKSEVQYTVYHNQTHSHNV